MVGTTGKVEVLARAYEARVGRPATVGERLAIRRAVEQIDASPNAMLARVALGPLMGVNRDWPLAMREAAAREFGLSEAAVR